MDGIMEMNSNDKISSMPITNTTNTNNNINESSPKETNTNTLKKRVHFSTQNSMVQVPRSNNSSNIYQIDTSTISTTNTCNAKDSTALTYATIYSNEYEPIGSENNSTNHYVDMDSKLGDERPSLIDQKSKIPPALPPKPPNLIKFRQILKMPAFPIQSSSNRNIHNGSAVGRNIHNDNESEEPDYCSIGDVQEAMKSVQIVADVHKNLNDDVSRNMHNGSAVQIVADVHKNPDDDVSSHASEETFADVPKLPNVKAIISPKKDPLQCKLILQENCITKTIASPPPRAKPTILPTKAVVANLLSEIHAQKPKIPLNNQAQMSKIITELDDNAKKSHLKLMNQSKMTTIAENAKIPHSQNPMKAIPIIKQNDKMLMPIQAEFDWYNLDVEYGKLLAPNLLENGKDSESDEHKQFGVEYNLDAEFSLTSCSLSSDNNSSIESSGSTIHFVPITVTEDCTNGSNTTTICNSIVDEDVTVHKNNNNNNNAQLLDPARLKKLISKTTTTTEVNVKSFDTFLEQTGLATKPLPQKRKIFYNAPFV